MANPSEPLQFAIVAAAEASAALETAMGGQVRIFDDVPPEAEWPCIVLDSMTFAPETAHSGDSSQTYDGGIVTATYHIWTREPGTVEAKKIGKAFKAAVLTDLVVADHRLIDFDLGGEAYARQVSDDPTARGIVTLRYDLQAA